MSRHWTDRMSCICGWSTFSTIAEAKHRHNFPLLCRPAKKARVRKVKEEKKP